MSYPLFVVWLFKTIVVVDGKWVWDSWILKNRHRVNGVKNMLCCWRLSEQSFLTEMEAETHRGRTFASWKAKVKLSHLWLQPKLNVKSQALNRNACVTPNYHKTAYATKKNDQNNDSEPKHFQWLFLKVQKANWVCFLRACPASRVYMVYMKL